MFSGRGRPSGGTPLCKATVATTQRRDSPLNTYSAKLQTCQPQINRVEPVLSVLFYQNGKTSLPQWKKSSPHPVQEAVAHKNNLLNNNLLKSIANVNLPGWIVFWLVPIIIKSTTSINLMGTSLLLLLAAFCCFALFYTAIEWFEKV